MEKTPQLERLHVEAVRAVDAWIDRRTIDPGLDVSQYTEVERQSYYQYGYRYTGDAFMPHITLGHTDDASAKLLVQRPVGRRFDTDRWIFDRVTFYEMGEHGAHSRVLADAPLRHA